MDQKARADFSIERFHLFDNLEILAKQVVEGFITGLHRSPYHGFSVEFAEHRVYNKGESTRHIDWKLYARTDKLFVKRYEEETNLRTQIVIDASSSMLFPYSEKMNKLEFSALMGAALTYLLKKQRDAIGLSVFADTLIDHLPAKLSSQHIQMLYSKFSQLMHVGKSQSDTIDLNRANSTPAILHQIAESIHKRSLIILFTDFFDSDSSENLFAALQHLKYNQHEVIVFHVCDRRREINLDYAARPTKFVDMETGEILKLSPNQLQDKYQSLITAHFDEIKLKCSQFDIDFYEADISSQPFDMVLQAYLLKRNKLF